MWNNTFIVSYIIDAILKGSSVLIPFLFIIYLFKIKQNVLKLSSVILAANLTMLLGSSLYILNEIIGLFVQYFSGTEYVQYSLGPYWQITLLYLAGLALLPQLFWFRKLRRSIVYAIIIVGFGFLLQFILFILLHTSIGRLYAPSSWAAFYPSFGYYLKISIIYVVIVGWIYWVVKSRRYR